MAWTQEFTDPFTGTQYTLLSTYSAAWATPFNNFRISTNGTSCGAGNTARAYLVTAPSNANHAASFVLTGSAIHVVQLGPLVRWTDGGVTGARYGTGYFAYNGTTGDNTLYIERLDGSGSFTQIASAGMTPASGDEYWLEAVGSDITFKQNGTLVWSVSDATYATGTVGMIAFSSFDDAVNPLSLDNFASSVPAAAAGGAIVFNRMIG